MSYSNILVIVIHYFNICPDLRVILRLRTYAQHIATCYYHISEHTCPNLCPQLAMSLYKHSLKGNFGNIIHDFVRKYDTLKIEQLRKYEKLKTKIRKAELDATFLKGRIHCETFLSRHFMK